MKKLFVATLIFASHALAAEAFNLDNNALVMKKGGSVYKIAFDSFIQEATFEEIQDWGKTGTSRLEYDDSVVIVPGKVKASDLGNIIYATLDGKARSQDVARAVVTEQEGAMGPKGFRKVVDFHLYDAKNQEIPVVRDLSGVFQCYGDRTRKLTPYDMVTCTAFDGEGITEGVRLEIEISYRGIREESTTFGSCREGRPGMKRIKAFSDQMRFRVCGYASVVDKPKITITK